MMKTKTTVCLINFFIAALMGLLLRFAHLHELGWMDFRKMMHAHSHIAMLGWAYLAVYVLIWFKFLPETIRHRPIYRYLFWFTQLTVIGMLISFPIQGYAFYSITFSTLHVLLSYVWVAVIWKKLQHHNWQAVLMLKTSLVWMLLSTLGLWVLGASMAGAGKSSALYYTSIQFFLHFQFNGWFTFAVLALFFTHLTIIREKNFNWFYALLTVSCLLTFALSVTWSTPDDALFMTNGLGVLLQSAALLLFLFILKKNAGGFLQQKSLFIKALFALALLSFALKIVIQLAVVVPQIAVMSYTIRQFVVGFIHLTMLGSVSAYLLGEYLYAIKKSYYSNMLKAGSWLFVSGFLFSEFILFFQGLLLWLELGFLTYYYEYIFAFSALLPVALIALMIGFYEKRTILS